MLRLPQPSLNIVAGCNFSIAQVLMAYIAGVSTVFFDAAGESRDRFVGLMTAFYPWHQEPDDGVKDAAGPYIIYDLYRNPFTHSLGLGTQIVGGKRSEKRVVPKPGKPLAVNRLVGVGSDCGLTEETLSELEGVSRPQWLPPTLEKKAEGGGYALTVEALYRGTRIMVEALTNDASAMKHADDFFSHGGGGLDNGGYQEG